MPRERMSDAEAIMWAVEKDPALRSDFCNLTLLDRRPDDTRLHATLERALAAIPRLRHRVVSAPLRLVPPELDEDPAFDPAYHLRRASVPEPRDLRALLDACAAAAEAPLDRSRPLWEFTLFEGLADGRAALLQKLHHTVSDGVGGLRLSLALLDLEPDPEPPVKPASAGRRRAGPVTQARAGQGGTMTRRTPVDTLRDAVVDSVGRNARAVRSLAAGTGRTLLQPARLPARVADAAGFVGSLRRQGLVTERARSDVLAGRSVRRHFEVHRVPFPPLVEAARTLGGSVNDVYVTGLAVALGRYHARFGSDAREVRMAMPVSTRARGEAAANRFVPTRVLVPIQPSDDPKALFGVVRERLRVTKRESAIPAAEGLAGLVSGLPTALLVALTRSQARSIDFAATSLRGSPVPLYLAGSRIVANYPFGPRVGAALNVTTLTYCDEFHIGLNVDPAAVTDIPALVADLRAAFDDLVS